MLSNNLELSVLVSSDTILKCPYLESVQRTRIAACEAKYFVLSNIGNQAFLVFPCSGNTKISSSAAHKPSRSLLRLALPFWPAWKRSSTHSVRSKLQSQQCRYCWLGSFVQRFIGEWLQHKPQSSLPPPHYLLSCFCSLSWSDLDHPSCHFTGSVSDGPCVDLGKSVFLFVEASMCWASFSFLEFWLSVI